MSVWRWVRWISFLGPGGADKEMKAAQTTCGLEHLLQIERRTMKDH